LEVRRWKLGTVLGLTEASSPVSDSNVVGYDSSRPVVPHYGGACLSSLLGALGVRSSGEAPSWLPEPCLGARQVVLLVLDGIGWEKLQSARSMAPTLSGAAGGPITSVAPTTTATALTSIATGSTPAEHGVVGYRLRLASRAGAVPADRADRASAANASQDDADSEVLNVLRWRTRRGDMRTLVPAVRFQTIPPFAGVRTPAVTRSEFAATGFTALHLAGAKLVGWALPSALVVQVRRLLGAGEPFVYAYYDGLDKAAHTHGLGEFYEEELHSVDRWVGDLIESLPPGSSLVLTSDHGQVEVGGATRMPSADLLEHVQLLSGEGRFRWFHALPGAEEDLLSAAIAEHGAEAWVRTRQEVVEAGWFGGPLARQVEERLGDVAVVAREAVAFLDPADTGETGLAARHGSLTAAEMYVPLVAWAG
jgi:predicted AlkP superfamily pyrophosphatase or phosphodiesterase